MNMQLDRRQTIIIGGGVLGLLLIIVAVVLFNTSSKGQSMGGDAHQEVSTAEPVDVALDFYTPWLNAVKSTSTDPYASGFATNKILSKTLSERLVATEGHAETDIDPVLCQITVPEGVNGRMVSQDDTMARVLVVSKDKSLTAQSTFTLKQKDDGWFIDDIVCAPGEFELPREFTFDREGYLLKSVPPPLDPQYWYIVFEENNELGHFAPLFLGDQSSCTSLEGTQSTCSTDQFRDAVKVHLYGQMTELGVEVSKIEFLE